MNEIYDYPAREHVEPIQDFYGALSFELDIHGDGVEFKKGIVALGKQYESTALLRSMQQAARLMSITHIASGHSETTHPFDADFYDGSILAMHSMLRVQTQRCRQLLLYTDMFKAFLTPQMTYDIPAEKLKEFIDKMQQWDEGGFMDSFNSEPVELQELVVEAAILMYSGTENARANEDSFISGFMMAKDEIVQVYATIVENGDTPPFYFQGPV